jgi:hypothetical protein
MGSIKRLQFAEVLTAIVTLRRRAQVIQRIVPRMGSIKPGRRVESQMVIVTWQRLAQVIQRTVQ